MSHAFVLFGATGDLAKRMIWPSLFHMDRDNLLPDECLLLGAAREKTDAEGLRKTVTGAIEQFVPAEHRDVAAISRFLARIDYCRVDASKQEDFKTLAATLGAKAERALYYLATAPSLYGAACQGLAKAGLAEKAGGVLLEKPIGKDLASSQVINDAVAAIFDENRIFRVDHYLGKEAVQNLMALRFANAIFEPLWNSRSIEHVQITIAETVGVEGRFAYYDTSGALRDMVQNHLLQLLCLVAMEPPAAFEPESVRNEKIKVLRSLQPIRGAEVMKKTVAGQYRSGVSGKESAPGYAEEGGADSRTETFVAIQAEINNWRWAGVPFFLRTGKRMIDRRTEIVVRFRPVPHNMFGAGAGVTQNQLRILLQPQETVELTIIAKEPGLSGARLRPVKLDLSLTKAFQGRRRIAYERLILDALRGDTTLFLRRDEIEAAWSWVDDISHGWAQADERPKLYPAGSWGPSAAIAMIERAGFSWAE
jgi:glucose-6-phosphate 1-dehydrogenase